MSADDMGRGKGRDASEVEQELAKLGAAAKAGGLVAVEDEIQIMMAKRSALGKFLQALLLKAAICENYSRIIRIADELIDSGGTEEQVKWAKDQKEKAQRGRAAQGCPGPAIS